MNRRELLEAGLTLVAGGLMVNYAGAMDRDGQIFARIPEGHEAYIYMYGRVLVKDEAIKNASDEQISAYLDNELANLKQDFMLMVARNRKEGWPSTVRPKITGMFDELEPKIYTAQEGGKFVKG
jgi:hypothetical protein